MNKISWVIANLLGNALRYTKIDGTGIIEIKAREVNNAMLVSICDNGDGIAEEYQKLIFEKFIQIKDKNGETTGSSRSWTCNMQRNCKGSWGRDMGR